MLNMLPKLALMVVRMYLSVLANVLRPSSMPSRRMSRSCFEQHQIGSIFRHVHGRIHRDADVGGVQGRRVVDAVAHVADDVPGLLQGQDDALLLVGIHFGEDGGAFGGVPERLVAQVIQVVSGQQAADRQVHRLRDVPRHQLVVAGDDLELHARVAPDRRWFAAHRPWADRRTAGSR